jgi:tetratricopeptide (TPR) repeat protein
MLDLVGMNEDGRQYQGESEIDNLVKRFERMIEDNDQHYFDLEEFEIIIGHYLGCGEMQSAKKVLQYASSLFPENLMLQLREAQMLSGIGKHIQAIPLLKTLLAFEPNNEEIHLTLANIYGMIKEHRLAISHFWKALNNSDIDFKADLYIDIALEHQNLGEWRKAISILKDSLYADPSNESALFELAFCYDKVGGMKDGVDFFNKYIDESPYSQAAWYNLGNLYNRLGRVKEAVMAYDFSIAIDSNYLRAYHQKAEALTAAEHYAEGLEAYKEILVHEPTSAYIICNIGECYERLGEFDKAEDYYKQSLDLDPEFTDAFVGLGVLADLQSLTSVAVQYFEHAVTLEAENIDYRLLLASSLIKMGKPKEAEKQFTLVLEREPKCEDAWEGRIDNLQQINAHDAALEALEQGLAVVKDSTHLLYQQVVSLFKSSKEAQAIDLFEHLLIHTFDNSSRIIDSFPELLEDPIIAEIYTRLKP